MAGEKKVASLYAELVLKNNLPDQLKRAKSDLRSFASSDLGGLEKQAEKTGASLGGITGGLSDALKRGGGAIKSFGAEMLALGGVTAGALGAAAVVKAAIGYESKMANIQAVTGATAGETAALKNELLKLGAASRQGPSAVADAYYDIVGGMANAAARMPTLKAAMDTATAGGADLAGTTQALITLLNSYGTSNLSAAAASDILTRTVGMGVGRMDEFAAAMAPIAGTLAQTGVKAQDLGSMLAYMTTKGMSASMSANSIQQAAVALLNPNERLKKILPQVLNEYDKINGKLTLTKRLTMTQALEQYGLVGVLKRVQDAAGGGKEAITQMLGSVEASRAAFALLGKDYAGFNKDYVTGLKGATEQAKDIQNKSTQAQLELLGSKLEAIAIKIGDVLLPIANAAATILDGVLGAAIGAFDGIKQGISNLLPGPKAPTAEQKAATKNVTDKGMGALITEPGTFAGYMGQATPFQLPEVEPSEFLVQVLSKKMTPDDTLVALTKQGIFPDVTLADAVASKILPATALQDLMKAGVDVKGTDTLAYFIKNVIPVDKNALTVLQNGIKVDEIEQMKLNQALGIKPELLTILGSSLSYKEELKQLVDLGLKPETKLKDLVDKGLIANATLDTLLATFKLSPSAALQDLVYVTKLKGAPDLMSLKLPGTADLLAKEVPLAADAKAALDKGIVVTVNVGAQIGAAAIGAGGSLNLPGGGTFKRAGGGPTWAGDRYQVGEGNRPEVLQEGGRQYLIPGDKGNVIPFSGTAGGGESYSIGVVNISGVNDPVRIFDQIQAEARRRNTRIG